MKRLFITLTLILVAFMANAQFCPDSIYHPHAIDLGLPSGTKWACCNVDSDLSKLRPENNGSYYAWGETEEKEIYDWTTYIHCDGSMETCHDIGSDIASFQNDENDAAHSHWGGAWVMPSVDHFQELVNNCSYNRTTINGVDGYQFTGPSGGTIFLPAAGFRWNDNLSDTDNYGYYWSSTLSPSSSSSAYCLVFNLDSAYWNYSSFRNYGHTVRPVIRGTNNIVNTKSSTDDTRQDVYNIYGIKVLDSITGTNTLPSGIYIVNGRKIVVK